MPREGWKALIELGIPASLFAQKIEVDSNVMWVGKEESPAFECAQVRFHSGLTGICDNSNGGKGEHEEHTGGFWRSFCLFDLLDKEDANYKKYTCELKICEENC